MANRKAVGPDELPTELLKLLLLGDELEYVVSTTPLYISGGGEGVRRIERCHYHPATGRRI